MMSLPVLVLGCMVAASGVLATTQTTPINDMEFLFYDFCCDSPAYYVKSYFSGVNVIKSLKAYGSGRYFFLIENDQSANLKMLSLPHNAHHIRVFSVEHLYTFFSHFGVTYHTPLLDFQPNENLTFLERAWNPTGMSQDEFAGALANQAANFPTRSKNQIFVGTASLPVQFFFFMNRNDFDTAEMLYKHTKDLGGPGLLDIHTHKVYNI